MSTHRNTARHDFHLGLVLVTLALCAVIPLSVSGAERMVICEEFTSTSCGFCPTAGFALRLMLEDYPDSFAVVQYHVGDAYGTPWGSSRANFYGLTGTPSAWFDGLLRCVGAQPSVNAQYNWYKTQYDNRRGVPTDVTIELTADELAEDTYRVHANVCVEPGDTVDKDMRIYMVQIINNWPASPNYHSWGFKQAAVPNEDITLSAGECFEVERVFEFDSVSMSLVENIKIVAWAQDPRNVWPAEVYQSQAMSWPFPAATLYGDGDGDGDIDQFDFELFVGCYAGPGVMDPPSGCDLVQFETNDFDNDGDVDFGDACRFQRSYTGPCGLTITQQPENRISCIGDAAVFEVEIDGYLRECQWQKDGEDIPGATDMTLVIDPVTLESAGIYTATLSDPCAVSVSEPAVLTVESFEPAFTVQPQSDDVCIGDTLFIFVSAQGHPTFQWYVDGEPIPGATSFFYTVPNAQPENSGIYDVEAINPCGVAFSEEAVIDVIDCGGP